MSQEPEITQEIALAAPVEFVSTHSVVGRTCEVFFDNKWYNAEIISSKTDDKMGEKVIVKLIGQESMREYLLVDVKLLSLVNVEDFPLESKIQAIWKDDGLWYNAHVKGISSDSAIDVVYDGFDGEIVSLPLDQVRLPVVVAKHKKPTGTLAEEKTYVTPAGYVIPENLKIDVNKDAEDVIAKKKRKIHSLKSQQRGERYVEEISSNVNKWQSFQKKFGSSGTSR